MYLKNLCHDQIRATAVYTLALCKVEKTIVRMKVFGNTKSIKTCGSFLFISHIPLPVRSILSRCLFMLVYHCPKLGGLFLP